MSVIVLIGAGQLGSRHLQSLANLSGDDHIIVVDPSTDSLLIAQQRYEQVAKSSSPNVSYCQRLNFTCDSIDICIIATSAAVRLDVLTQLLSRYLVRHLILEKVLFQNDSQAQVAAKLIDEGNIPTWVNCSRRQLTIYQKIKAYLGESNQLAISVTGDNWGLGCNAFHFIDLWSFLSDSTDIQFDMSGLDKKRYLSKRAGFEEVFGKIVGHSPTGHLSIACQQNDAGLNIAVEIQTSEYKVLINETKRYVRFYNRRDELLEEVLDYEVPMQSQLTHTVVNEILTSGDCLLPKFDTAYRLHTSFITSLLSYFNSRGKIEYQVCPIT